jgi:hypothetical protein
LSGFFVRSFQLVVDNGCTGRKTSNTNSSCGLILVSVKNDHILGLNQYKIIGTLFTHLLIPIIINKVLAWLLFHIWDNSGFINNILLLKIRIPDH